MKSPFWAQALILDQDGHKREFRVHTRRHLLIGMLGFSFGRRPAGSSPNSFPVEQVRRFQVPLVDEQGRVVSRYDAAASYFVEDLGAGITLEMALIPSGSFDMGSNLTVSDLLPEDQNAERPIHRVSVKPFAVGVFLVTRGQWRLVSSLPAVSRNLFRISRLDMPLQVENQLPIDIVSWDEAVEFCARLQRLAGRSYRLPSEAEWEYACRAGTTTNYHFGEGISLAVANYNDGVVRPVALTPVGSKQAPNRFSLHDMHGNAFEWCADWWYPSYDGAPTDGSAWNYGGDSRSRVSRGGTFGLRAERARSAARWHGSLSWTFSGQGFRLALDMPDGRSDPRLVEAGVRNAASGLPGAIAPGEIATLFGTGIGPSTAAVGTLDDRGSVSTEIAGTRVWFDDAPAPLLYVATGQINAVAPYALSGQRSTQVRIENQGQSSAPVWMPVAESSPALFTADGSGRGQAAALNQDGSFNSADHPAPRGSVVSLFGTGEGQTHPPGLDGKLAVSPLPAPILPVRVWIADVEAELQYAGAAPGEIAGVLQINARVPATITAGRQPIVVRIGEARSPADVILTVG